MLYDITLYIIMLYSVLLFYFMLNDYTLYHTVLSCINSYHIVSLYAVTTILYYLILHYTVFYDTGP